MRGKKGVSNKSGQRRKKRHEERQKEILVLWVITFVFVISLLLLHVIFAKKAQRFIALCCILILLLAMIILFLRYVFKEKSVIELIDKGKKDRIKEKIFLGGLANSKQISMIYLDKDLNILCATKRVYNDLLIREMDIEGRNLFEIPIQNKLLQLVSNHLEQGNQESNDIIGFNNEDGEQIWLWVEINTLYANRHENNYLITVNNTTTYFHVQTLLEASMEVTNNIILFFDNNGNILYCSEIAARKIGISSRMEAVGLHYSELYDKNMTKSTIDHIVEVLKKGERFHEICHVKEGTTDQVKWYKTDAVNITISNEKYGCVVFLNDITEQIIKSQELSETLQLRERLIMTISHEIRNPMNAILGSSELLILSKQFSQNDKVHINNINEASRVLINIMDEVTDYTKIETRDIVIENEEFDLYAMIDELYNVIKVKANEKDLTVVFDIDPLIPQRIIGDKKRLKQILRHLMMNGVKFTSKGHIILKIIRIDVDEKMSFKYIVEDTGMGIECDDKTEFFDTLNHMKKDRDQSNLGLGLGLLICRELVSLMGGRLSFESEKDKGSIFYFVLETESPAEKSLDKPSEDCQEILFQTKGVKVLVADDNDVNQLVVTTMLNQFGVMVDQVTSGSEAIEMACKHVYDIIFMDYMMPQMDGLEATMRIRSASKAKENKIIIALSANVIMDTKRIFEGNWVNGVLAKPIELNDIAKILKKWLPKEKLIIEKTVTPLKQQTNYIDTDFDRIFCNIKYLDTSLGLKYFAGESKKYVEVLQMSYENIKNRIDHIDNMMLVQELSGLKLDIHSIKGIMLNIGVVEIANFSKEIEEGIDNNNTAFKEKMNHYIQIVQNFLNQLGQALIEYTMVQANSMENEMNQEVKITLTEKEFQLSKHKLLYYLSRYEYANINEEFQKLLNCREEERKKKLSDVEVLIQNFQYDEALMIVHEIE